MWLEAVFFVGIVPIVIILGIAYGKSKKLSPLLYILSIFALINTVAYVIDAYPLGRNGILLMLILAAVLLMGLGYYLNRELQTKPRKGEKHFWNKAMFFFPQIIMVIFAIIGVFNIGVQTDLSYGQDIPRAVMFPGLESTGNCSYAYTSNQDNMWKVSTLDFTNKFFLDRSVEVPRMVACFDQQTIGLPQIQHVVSYVEDGKEIVAASKIQYYETTADTVTAKPGQTKRISIYVQPYCQMRYDNYYPDEPRVKPGFPEKPELEDTSDVTSVYLFRLDTRDYKDCYTLLEDEEPVHVFRVV